MKSGFRALPLVVVIGLCGLQARALPIEVVVGDPQVYGQAQNGFPFGTLPQYYGYPSTRYQQVYASSAFSAPLTIRELIFYPSGNVQATTLPATLEIFFSVTNHGVNEISFRPFDENLGADTRFFAALQGGISPTGGEFVILGKPFLYDPTHGNLLVDIRVDGAPLGYAGPYFASLAPDNFARIAAAPFSRWHDFGVGFDNYGLVTGFRGYVPEPGTLALLSLGIVGVGLAKRRKAS